MTGNERFENWYYKEDDYWDHSDPGHAMAQRAWNKSLEELRALLWAEPEIEKLIDRLIIQKSDLFR